MITNPFFFVGPAHPDVVETALVAQRDRTLAVDLVVAHSVALDIDAGL